MRDFFKVAAASAVGTLVGLFSLLLLVSIGAFGLIGVLLSSGDGDSEVALGDKSLLVFDLENTNIIDGLPAAGGALLDVYGDQRSVSLYSSLEAIAAAAKDDKISGIFIKGNADEGLATLKEVRKALSDFKASGKPIWVYSTGFDEATYYLASVADNLVLAPVGSMELNGFRAETQFLANALQKYGVGVQVLRVGRYKSAIEPFIRNESSPESKQQTEALIGDLWKDFLQTVASDRDITPQQLQKLADEVALIEPKQALESGLVDRLAFYDEVLTELKTLTGTPQDQADEDMPQMELADYAQMTTKAPDAAADKVAVVYAEGNIVVGDEVIPGAITSEGMATALREIRHDESIKAVVLRVNSPGGSAIASEMIADEVKLLAKAKPLIVSMGDYAASGGYMIAAPGAKILASPTTITGSIGVYGLLLNFQEIANKNGVSWDVVKTAKFADMQTNVRPQTEAELKIQQGYVDSLYDRFMTIVADGRSVSKERVGQVAQGRVWTGEDAIAANLVDQLGGLNDAIALAAKTADIETYAVEEFPELPSIEEQLLDSVFGMGATTLVSQLPWNKDPLTDQLLKLREEFTLLESLNDPNNTYMRLPFTTEID
jgi:protease IV